jgi:REP element-mobilizing transposase RayT
MARKPRIHYPGAFYHVMLRGNGGQDIFFSDADRSRFYLLLQEGIERYKYRIHAFCQMTNHVHLAIQVGNIPLSRIMQNVSFRYARYINSEKNKIGHLFQGRYKALLIDGDSYFVELVRYIHCNPVRAGLAENPNEYQWSSHNAYLGKSSIPWLTVDLVLSQFADQKNRAGKLYDDFIQAGITEPHRHEFHRGTFDGRILGDENFSEKALALADEKSKNRRTLNQILDAVCWSYGLDQEILLEPGKKQPGAEARAIAAYLVQEEEHLSLTELGTVLNRDSSALSRAAGRIRERKKNDSNLADRVASTRGRLLKIS